MAIEESLKRYSDVPASIIIKIEVLRHGVQFGQAALEDFKGREDMVFKSYHLFSYDRKGMTSLFDRIPADFTLLDGTPIQTRVNEQSNFKIDKIDDRFFLSESGNRLAEVTFQHRPRYFAHKLANRLPAEAIIQALYGRLLFLTINKYCEMWKDGHQCLFCDFNNQTLEQRRRGEKVDVHKNLEDILQVLGWATDDDPNFTMMLISGGTILTSVHGKDEITYYVDYLQPMSRYFQKLKQVHFQVRAHKQPELRRLHNTGITCVQSNLEVWDPCLFERMCPGKTKFIGRDEWVRRLIDGVEVFGRGNVISNFVTGSEMARPFGFPDVKSALKSTLGGFDYLMANGVLPRMDMWMIEGNSSLGDQEPPPLEYYVELGRGYTELLHKHGLPPYLDGQRGRNDPINDWEYWYTQGKLKLRGSEQ